MNTLMNASLSMTSREIAELTAKTHAHVLRDIDNLLETLNPELASGFKASTYVSGDPPREYRQFILDRDSAYCLVAGTAGEFFIPVFAELLPDGSVRIPEMILRGGQLTMLAKVFEDGCVEFIGDTHVDECIGQLYLIAAINEDGE